MIDRLWRAIPTLQSTSVVQSGRPEDMQLNINVNPTSEHALYLKLFITNGGGW